MTASAPREIRASQALFRRGPALGVLSVGLPLALGLASHALVNLVDLLLVGRLGERAVLVAHVASTWNFLPMILGNCIATALLARLSRRLGRGDEAGARQLNRRAQWFMGWFGALVSVATALPAGIAVAATGLTGEAASEAVHYLVVSNLGCLPMFVLMQATSAMRAAGEVAIPLAVLLLANVVNLALDVILLFGWDAVGLPSMGVVGAAYATVAARAVAGGFALVWLSRRRHVLSLCIDSASRDRPVARALLLDAWPQVAQIGLRAGLVVAMTVVVQRQFGASATAALGIATRFDTVILFAALGFANAATAYAARAVVSRRPGEARCAGLWAAVQAGAFGASVVLLLQLGSRTLVDWFLPAASPEVHATTDLYFGVASWGQVLGAVALGAIGAVHGAGRMLAPLVVDVVGFGVAFLLLGLAAGAGGGIVALYEAMILGMSVVAVLHLAHVAFGRWPLAV